MTDDNSKSLVPINGQLTLARIGEIISITNNLLPLPQKNVLLVDDRVNDYEGLGHQTVYDAEKDNPAINSWIRLLSLEFKEFFGDKVNLIGYVNIEAADNFLRENYKNIDLVISDELISDLKYIHGPTIVEIARELDSSIPCITHTAYGLLSHSSINAYIQKSAELEYLCVICGILLFSKNIFTASKVDRDVLCKNIHHIINNWGVDAEGDNNNCSVLYLSESSINSLKTVIEGCQ